MKLFFFLSAITFFQKLAYFLYHLLPKKRHSFSLLLVKSLLMWTNKKKRSTNPLESHSNHQVTIYFYKCLANFYLVSKKMYEL